MRRPSVPIPACLANSFPTKTGRNKIAKHIIAQLFAKSTNRLPSQGTSGAEASGGKWEQGQLTRWPLPRSRQYRTHQTRGGARGVRGEAMPNHHRTTQHTTSITNLPANPSTPQQQQQHVPNPKEAAGNANHSGFGTAAPHAAVSGASLRGGGGGANGFTVCTPHHLCPSQNSESTPLWSPAWC